MGAQMLSLQLVESIAFLSVLSPQLSKLLGQANDEVFTVVVDDACEHLYYAFPYEL
jgi:hypothetical protein